MPAPRVLSQQDIQNAGGDSVAREMAANPQGPLRGYVEDAPPSEFGFDAARYPFRFYLQDGGPAVQRRGRIDGLDWQARMAAALAGPRIYCDAAAGGSADSTGAGTLASPYQSIGRAYGALQALGVPGVVMVKGSETGALYPYQIGFLKQATYAINTDVVFMAYNGRVVTGPFDSGLTWTADSFYNWCYRATRQNAQRLVDMSQRNPLTGYYAEPVKVASAEVCSLIPGSYFIDTPNNQVLYNPSSGVVPTNANTRVYMSGIENFYLAAQCNVFLAGQTENDGFDLEGSRSACFAVQLASFNPAVYSFVGAKNCTFRYAGYESATASTQRAALLDTLNGLAYFENCDFGAARSDGMNVHNVNGDAANLVITLNCSFSDNGRVNNTSQGYTLHETVKAIDVGGLIRWNHGGNIRNIGSSMMWAFGTTCQEDRGDMMMPAGGIRPTEVRIDDTSKFWGSRMTVAAMSAGDFAFRTTVNGQIRLRNTQALRGINAGNISEF